MGIFSIIYHFDSFFITVLAFILCLSVIVFVHEFGHYFVGKLSGIKAEVFSVGFGPVLFARYDKNGTKWQVAAFPFGGFVKFLGDKNDASASGLKSNSATETAVSNRASIHGAPLWARFLTVAAGPIFNFIFSGVIFFLIYMNQGITKIPLTVETLFDAPSKINFLQDDVIISVNGIPLEGDLDELSDELRQALSDDLATYVVKRDGKLISFENINQNPPRIFQVLPKSAAISAGLETGDVILSINSEQIKTFNQIKKIVETSNGEPLTVEYWRKGAVYFTNLKPTIVDVPMREGGFERIYRIGVVGGLFPFDPVTSRQSFGQAFFASINSIYSIMEGSVKGLYHILFGNISSCNLSGPISIAETSGQMVKQGGLDYLWFVAVLSTAIGMINLFPIPVLDGGHLMFFAFEAALGKKLNPKIVNGFMNLGFSLLIILMIFALFNDLFCP